MKYIFYTNIVSPHQIPWCREFVKLVGEENFLYIAEESLHQERKELGWNHGQESWICELEENRTVLQEKLESCDILITSLRNSELLKKRAEKGLRSYYMFERWFKPPVGAFRMLHPGYRKICGDFNALASNSKIRLLPIGIYAVEDFFKMQQCLKNPFCLFTKNSELKIEKNYPAMPLELYNMRLWGYFVAPGDGHKVECGKDILNLFWCGRMLDWKRVNTLVKAIVNLLKRNIPVKLTLVGHGPEEGILRKIAGKWINEKIYFKPPAKIDEIRQYMQNHDAYILSSDGGEGWGAALNEAMNEGMIPVGTFEAGSSATMIEHGKNGFLYHSKNVKELECILEQIWNLKKTGKDQEIRNNAVQTIHDVWSPENAAVKLLEDCNNWMKQ